MVNARIATSAEQPINRHAGNAKYEGEEAELVGLDSNGDVVKADADSAVAQPAHGVLFSPVDHYSNYTVEAVKSTIEANRTIRDRDRVSFVGYGVEIENGDDDWDFTKGEPVYLAVGGGYTQTAPSGVGEVVQQVGVALTEERIRLNVQDHEVIDYNAGDAAFSGDASATSFNIAHSLSAAPSEYRVTPTSADAAADYHVTVDGTNITVNFAAAPASGTDNVTFNWYAKE